MSGVHARWSDGTVFAEPIGKIVCVGRNYAEHARELNNPVPETPLLFIKPATSVVPLEGGFDLGGGGESVHYETELALLIGSPLRQADSESDCRAAVVGLGLALDLTLRDVQSALKAKGHPWEIAKGFDGACPLSAFMAVPERPLEALEFTLALNGVPRQHGRVCDMLTSPLALLAYISRHFTLCPGDVVLTGTPAGVGPLARGDRLSLVSNFGLRFDSEVR